MPAFLVYLTAPLPGNGRGDEPTVHVGDDVEVWSGWATGNTIKTLCGRVAGDAWSIGDESASGVAATCGSCRRIIKARTS